MCGWSKSPWRPPELLLFLSRATGVVAAASRRRTSNTRFDLPSRAAARALGSGRTSAQQAASCAGLRAHGAQPRAQRPDQGAAASAQARMRLAPDRNAVAPKPIRAKGARANPDEVLHRDGAPEAELRRTAPRRRQPRHRDGVAIVKVIAQ